MTRDAHRKAGPILEALYLKAFSVRDTQASTVYKYDDAWALYEQYPHLDYIQIYRPGSLVNAIVVK